MATAGASQLSGLTPLRPLAFPLLCLAIAEAALIPVLGALARRCAGDCRLRLLPGVPAEGLFGDFTVPVGLAVIGTGLARIGTGPAVGAALGATALAWVTTLALVGRVVAPVAVRRPGLAGVDGAWFLGPAALLADAMAVAAIQPRVRALGPGLTWLALVTCALGVVAYAFVLSLATLRVSRAGMGGTARSPWWISAGCGGLAAACVGRVAQVAPGGVAPRGGVGPAGFAAAALALWAIGTALLVPVLAGSLAYLARWLRPHGSPPWPPTFSTGVYALGAIQAGRLGHLRAVSSLGRAAGLATLGLWAVTAAMHAAWAARRSWKPG